jgi:hypothetical protein
LKILQARHQPGGREGRRDAHSQNAVVGGRRDAPRGLADLPECVAHRRQIVLPGLGQDDAAVDPLEQGHVKMLLERLEHLAHRAGGHAELVRGILDRQMPRRRLEGAQRVQWRKPMTGHLVFLIRIAQNF